jgi:hypothetical protein
VCVGGGVDLERKGVEYGQKERGKGRVGVEGLG